MKGFGFWLWPLIAVRSRKSGGAQWRDLCGFFSGTNADSKSPALGLFLGMEVVELLVQRWSDAGIDLVRSFCGARLCVVVILVLAHFDGLLACVSRQLRGAHRRAVREVCGGIARRGEVHPGAGKTAHKIVYRGGVRRGSG